ncbi:MAG: hypothetical protein GYB66_01370, partial [Chloroflexi bacterium]|nr:hypothetical protein [Chloroflexota bacterium]
MPPIGRGRSLRLIFAILALILMAVAIGWVLQDRRAAAATPSPTPQSIAQQATATPGSVILPTSTSTAPPATPTETRTPTPAGPVYVEARNPDTNVRSGPDISNDRLGQIQPGERYPVLGRRFRWLQIEYPNT